MTFDDSITGLHEQHRELPPDLRAAAGIFLGVILGGGLWIAVYVIVRAILA